MGYASGSKLTRASVLDPNQAVSVWADQSGSNHVASQGSSSIRPTVVGNIAHGHAGNATSTPNGTYLTLPSDLMDGATAGEVFAVLRASDPTAGVKPWPSGSSTPGKGTARACSIRERDNVIYEDVRGPTHAMDQ